MVRIAEQAQADIGLALRGVREGMLDQVKVRGCCKQATSMAVLWMAKRLGLDLAIAAAGVSLAIDIVDSYDLDVAYTGQVTYAPGVGWDVTYKEDYDSQPPWSDDDGWDDVAKEELGATQPPF